jgi:hypothetical protein
VLALGLFFALDVVMVQYLESRGGAEMARTMAAEDVTLDLGGFPFIPRFLGGSLSNVSAQVHGASAKGGLRVQLVDAEAEGFDFAAGKIFALARSSFATKTDVTAKQAIVRVQLAEGDINDYMRRLIPVVGDVQVRASGIEVRFLKPGVDPEEAIRPSKEDLTKPARLIPAMDGGRFYLSLLGVSQIPPAFRAEAERLERLIELPKFPKGLSSEVRLGEEVVLIEALGAEVTVEVGEAEDVG